MLQALKGTGGPVTAAVWAGSRAIIATVSGRIKIFHGQEELATFLPHVGRTTGLALHPSGDIMASVGDDKSYVLYDLDTMATITQVYTDSGMRGTCSHLRTLTENSLTVV